MSARDLLLILVVMIIWGLNFPIAKIAFDSWPPILVIAARFCVTAAVLLPFARFPRGRFRQVALLSFTLGTVHFSLMFTGVDGTDASIAAILAQTQVPFAALLAWIYLGERPGWATIAGQVIAFAGVIVLAGEPRVASSPLAAAMVVVASLVWAVSAIQVKRMGQIDSITLSAWMSLLAVPQLAIVSVVLERGQWVALTHPDIAVGSAVLYMALGVTVIGYVVWYRLLARHNINLMMAFTLLVPLFGVIGGYLILDEPIGWRRIIGGLIVVLGVAIISLWPGRPAAAAH